MQALNDILNIIYIAVLPECEAAELRRELTGNGHHMAQAITLYVETELKKRRRATREQVLQTLRDAVRNQCAWRTMSHSGFYGLKYADQLAERAMATASVELERRGLPKSVNGGLRTWLRALWSA